MLKYITISQRLVIFSFIKTLSNSSADTDGRRRMEEQVGTLDKELENAVFALEKLVANLESRITSKRGLVGQGSRLKKLTRMLD